MAKAGALSPIMTHRIWQAHELQPHQVETFKLSGDADLNDATRLSTDPTFRLIGSPTRWDRSAALTSTLHLFETELLSRADDTHVLRLSGSSGGVLGRGRAAAYHVVRLRTLGATCP